MIRVLSPLAYRVKPWKNGGGTTTDIAVHPEGAGWDEFIWRVGIADIRQSGPFSSFPGVDRSIMLLDCPPDSGMTLSVDDANVKLVQHEFVDFAGEAVTQGHLRGEAVRDFNVMSRRGAVRHRRGWRVLAWNEWFRMGGHDWRFVYIAAGAAQLVTDGAAPRDITAGDSVIVSGEDALNLRGVTNAQLVWAAFSSAA